MIGTFSNSGLGFGIAFTLEDQFSGTSQAIQRNMEGLSGTVDGIAKKMQQNFGKIYSGIAMIGTGMGLLHPIKEAIMAASAYEQTKIQFATILGSAELAKQKLDEVNDLAVKSIFDLPQIEKGYQQLMAAGFATDKLRESFTALADIASGTGGNMEGMIQMYGRVQAKGKLYQRELTGFIDNHFNIIQALRDIGVKVKFGGGDISKQNISFQQVRAAILHATEAGGRFNDLIFKLAQTTMGKLSNIHDYIERILRQVGEALEPIIKPALDKIMWVLQKLSEFFKTTFGKVVAVVLAAGLAFIALSIILVGLTIIFQVLAAVVGEVLVELAPFIAAFAIGIALLYTLNKLLNSTNSLLFGLGIALMFAMGYIGVVFGVIILLVRAWREFNAVMDGSKQPTNGFIGMLQKIGGVMKGIVAIFSAATEHGWTMSLQLESALKRVGILEFVVNLGTWIVRIKNFFRGIKEAFVTAYTALKDFVHKFDEVVKPMVEWTGLIDKNKSAMEKWKTAGKIAGYVLIGVIVALTLVMVSFAVTTIIAFLPILLLIGALVVAVWVLYKVFKLLFQWIIAEARAFIHFNKIAGIIHLAQVIGNFAKSAWNSGVGFVKNLWNGIKSMWGSFKGWLKGEVASIPILGTFINGGFGSSGNAQVRPAYAGASMYGAHGMANYSAQLRTHTNTSSSNSSEVHHHHTPVVLHNRTDLDGRTIAKSVVKHLNEDAARH